jgi:hypothetical protein
MKTRLGNIVVAFFVLFSSMYALEFEALPMPPALEETQKAPELVLIEANPFGESAFTLEGTFASDIDASISIIDLDGTVYFTDEVTYGKYKLFFPEFTGTKEFKLKVTTANDAYFIDISDKVTFKSNADLILDDKSVATNLNNIVISDANRYSKLDIDLTTVDNNKYIVNGTINTDFTGEITVKAIDTYSGLSYSVKTSDKTFSMKLLNESSKYLFTITTDKDMIIQDGGMVISTQNIPMVTTSNGQEIYLANTLTLNASNNLNINMSTFTENTFSFDLNSMNEYINNTDVYGYSCKLHLLDTNGNIISNMFSSYSCEDEIIDGNKHEFNLGNLSGNFVLKLEQFISFKDNGAYAKDEFYIGKDSQVVHTKDVPISQVTPINIDSNDFHMDINLNNYVPPTKYAVTGSFTGTTATKIEFYHPLKRLKYEFDISEGSFSADIPEGKYIVKVFDDTNEFTLSSSDGDYDSQVEYIYAEDIVWGGFDTDGTLLPPRTDYTQVAYYAPSNVTLMNLTKDTQIPVISLTPLVYKDFVVEVDNLTKQNDKIATLELSRKSHYTRWSQSVKVADGKASFTFSDLRDEDDYVLSLYIDGSKRLYYSNNSWTENGYYQGYQDDVMCEDYKNYKYECDYTKTVDYQINIDGFSIPDSKTTVSFPSKSIISGTLNIGTEYKNKDISISISGNSIYQLVKKDVDSSGNVPFSFEVSPESGYTIFASIDYKRYAIQNDNGYNLTLSSNAFNNLGRLDDSVKLDASSDLALGTLELPTMKKIKFNVSNLEDSSTGLGENILIAIFGDNGWYVGSAFANSEGEANIDIEVPAGSYQVSISPSKNKSGMIISDNMTNIDLSTTSQLSWKKTEASTINIGADTTIALKLKSLNSFKYISGSTELGEGFICATRGNDGKCSKVDKNGNFKIDGLSPSDDYKYLLEYWSNDSKTVRKMVTMASGNSLENQIIELPEAKKISVTGTITGTAKEVLLLEVNDTDNSWKIIASKKSVNNFSFNNISEALDGFHYEVVVATMVMDPDTGAATYTMYNATKLDNTQGSANDVGTSGSITVSIGE